MSETPLLRVEGLSMNFGPIAALKSVSLSFAAGRVHGLAGENGAGKSTLLKILCGVHTRFQGQIELGGKPHAPANPAEAEEAGLSMFHQEVPVCPNLSVAANLFLGPRLPGSRLFPDWGAIESRCRELFRDWLGLGIDPRRRMRDCTIAERQLVLLVRALSRKARLVILDEPTTALAPEEVSRLFGVIRRLQNQGVTLVLVSHLLGELMEICDEIHVLRDGCLVGHLPREQYDAQHLASLVAGRTLRSHTTRRRTRSATSGLEVRELSRQGAFQRVSFSVASGEIVGLTGLQGSGRSDLLRALFGAPPAERGEIWLNGARLRLRRPADAIACGIGYVPEDRRNLGLFDDLDVESNLGMARVSALSRLGWLPRRKLRALCAEFQQKLRIKTSHPGSPILSLSGGNQQKVLIARWLAIAPAVLLMNEPTRGVDVGAKDEICTLFEGLAESGCACLLASSDLDELIRLADRVLVMSCGRIAAEFSRAEVSKDRLVRAAAIQTEGLRAA